MLISSDATALIVLSDGGAFEVDVAEPPDTIAGYVARPPATVVTLTNGLVRAYSRMYPEGIDLGSARGVCSRRSDPKRVWLSGVVDGGAAVKEMPVDGTVPPQLATGFIRLPEGYEVVGVAGRQLVLSGTETSLNPFELRTWDPETRTTSFVTQHGTLIAAGDGALAWTRPGCADCGIYLRRGDTISIVKAVPNVDPTVSGGVLTRRSLPRGRDHGGLAGRRHRCDRARRRRRRPRPRPHHGAFEDRDARHPVDDSCRR